MAITYTAPNTYMAGNNQVPFTIVSTNANDVNKPNFNFVVDINQTAGTNNPLARLKYPSQPSSNQITIDIGNVLKNYVGFDFNNVTAVFAVNTTSRLKYYVEFRELYDISGVPTLSGVLASSPTTPSTSSFNSVTNSIFDFEDYTPTVMTTKDVTTIGFLNANATTENINTNQERFLSWFDPSLLVKYIQYTGANGNVVTAVSLTTKEFLFSTRAGKYAQDLLIAGGISIIDTYRIDLLNVSSVSIANKTFKLNTECTNYPTIRLHYLNKLGAFDTFNFNKNSIKSLDIERKQFKAPLPIGYAKQDRLKTNYNTTINDSIIVNSDWISEAQSIQLEELATSPIIYLERSPTSFVAVNIANTSYDIKTFINDRRLFNITLELKYTYSRYRQTI